MIPIEAQYNHIRRLNHVNAIEKVYTLQHCDNSTSAEHLLNLAEALEPELALLLHKYKQVFDTLSSLPPPRNHDYYIT